MTFIVAECGSNWRDLNDCRHSIAMAKAAGADAVKFQAFNWYSLYGHGLAHTYMADDDGGNVHPVPKLDGALPLDWLPHLKQKADSVGIEFMCSAFSPELYDAVNPFVTRHKVASAEMSHIRILEKLRGYGKPVILSTGAHGGHDIGYALDHLGSTPTTLMYCVANYPAKHVDLRVMSLLRKRFKRPVGFSDHTLDIAEIPRRAAVKGAAVIEKHFTAIPDVDTPDRDHSLNVDQFKTMVQAVRGSLVPRIGYTGEENDMVSRHNRRLIATRDIAPGDVLQEGVNFGIYRSLKDDIKGLSPFAVGQVHGKTAKAAIAAGDGIGPGDV